MKETFTRPSCVWKVISIGDECGREAEAEGGVKGLVVNISTERRMRSPDVFELELELELEGGSEVGVWVWIEWRMRSVRISGSRVDTTRLMSQGAAAASGDAVDDGGSEEEGGGVVRAVSMAKYGVIPIPPANQSMGFRGSLSTSFSGISNVNSPTIPTNLTWSSIGSAFWSNSGR